MTYACLCLLIFIGRVVDIFVSLQANPDVCSSVSSSSSLLGGVEIALDPGSVERCSADFGSDSDRVVT